MDFQGDLRFSDSSPKDASYIIYKSIYYIDFISEIQRMRGPVRLQRPRHRPFLPPDWVAQEGIKRRNLQPSIPDVRPSLMAQQ